MNPNQPSDPLIGRLVDSRYRIRARIARGGMATVYVATDLRLERRIALKVMHAHLSDDTVFQGRFIQEARAAARLADPHVVNVFDQGQDGELAYLVMEYLPGITLRELLKEQKRLTIAQTVTVMDAILSGLAAAHRANIVHRDVKPENVLLAEDGRIKIGDFGLARATTANTATGQQLMGTIAYLAPELVTRGTADARSDIYSLGIMLYEMLVGEQPYRGEQPMQIAYQHATESVPRPSAKNPAVPEQLDELVLWATEKDPQQRPLDASTMLDRLRSIEREIGIAPAVSDKEPLTGAAVILDEYDTGGHTSVLPATSILGATGPSPDADQADNATRLRRVSTKRHKRGFLLVAIVAILTLLAGGVGWYFGSGPGSQVVVPAVAGSSYDDAAKLITAQELVPSREDRPHSSVPAGTVISTSPAADTRVNKKSGVTIIVSSGPQKYTIEQHAFKTEDDAVKALDAMEIKTPADQRTYEYSQDVAAGSLLWLSFVPAAGGDAYNCWEAACTAFGGDTAKLYVSLGPFTNVTGMALDAAKAKLTQQKITLKTTTSEFSGETPNNVVMWMSAPPADRGFRPGDSVDLLVSAGPFTSPVGMTLDKARSTITGQGLTVGNEGHDWSDKVPAGTIISISSPPQGRNWRPGDSVSLVISDGRKPITVPDLKGKTVREAMTQLADLGLSPKTELPNQSIPAIGNLWDVYRVASLDPAAGSTLYAGDSVKVAVRAF